MAKTRQQKEALVKQVSGAFDVSKGIAFASYSGLSVKETEELRAKMREGKAGLVMMKKTLLSLVLREKGIDVPADAFPGPLGVGFAPDEVMAAKVLHEFGKSHEDKVKLLGGVLEGVFIDGAKATELAALPSKQELLSKLVGAIKAPVSGLVNVLQGNVRGLVTVLKAIGEQKA